MNQKNVHYLVLEQLTGLGRILPRLRTQLLTGASIAVAAAAVILASGVSDESTISLSLGVAIAGIPVGVLLQRLTLRASLSRDQLRLVRFMIGKKGYVAPKSRVPHHEADLFSVACSLVCLEPNLSPNSSAAAWHGFSLADKPGVAACSGWYGNDGRQVIFLYGDPGVLLDECEDIWDLGHMRKLAESDIERYKTAVTTWKRLGLTPLALAYVPSADAVDAEHIALQTLRPHSCLLGLVGVNGSRGPGDTYSIDSVAAAQTAAHISLVGTIALAALAVGSVLAHQVFQTPVGIGLGQIIGIKLFVEPIVLASLSWDGRQKKAQSSKQTVRSAAWAGLAIAMISYVSLMSYNYILRTAPVDSRLQSASAISLLALGSCLLAYMWWVRQRTLNPLFVLALASGLLGVLIAVYATGPLLMTELLAGIGSAVIFLLLLELYGYSERHHSREHIIELLKSNLQS